MKTLAYTKTDGKYYKDNPKATQRRNTIRDMAGKMVCDVGGRKRLFALPKDERVRFVARAKKQYSREQLGDVIYNIFKHTRTRRPLPEIDRPKSKRVTTIQVNDPRGFVYIFKDHMKDEGFYKIGSSYKVKERLDQANIWGDFESIYESEEVADCAKLEKEVHKSLRKYQVKGEWFKITEDNVGCYLAINKIKELVDENFSYVVAS